MRTEPHHRDPETKNILNLYGAFGAGLLMTLLPSITFAIMASVFITGVLIAGYIMRGRVNRDSLTHNHATFIIRTIWLGTFYAMITVIIASIYMNLNLSFSELESCAVSFASSGISLPQTGSAEEMNAMIQNMMGYIQPCLDGFLNANHTLFINSAIIAAAPIVVYFIIRFARGISRAMKGHRLGNPNSWV